MKKTNYKCPHCNVILTPGGKCKCGYIAPTGGNRVCDRAYDPRDNSWDVGW